jgi:hypothetical protein
MSGMNITRRTFFKAVATIGAAFALERHVDALPKFLEAAIAKESRETIDFVLENDGWYKSWIRFPRLAGMPSEERERYWISLRVYGDKYLKSPSILEVPAFLCDDEGIFQLCMPISVSPGSYLVANLCWE